MESQHTQWALFVIVTESATNTRQNIGITVRKSHVSNLERGFMQFNITVELTTIINSQVRGVEADASI